MGVVGGKDVFPHPNELLIQDHPENLVKIRLMVQELVKAGGGNGGCKNILSIPLFIIDLDSP